MTIRTALALLLTLPLVAFADSGTMLTEPDVTFTCQEDEVKLVVDIGGCYTGTGTYELLVYRDGNLAAVLDYGLRESQQRAIEYVGNPKTSDYTFAWRSKVVAYDGYVMRDPLKYFGDAMTCERTPPPRSGPIRPGLHR